MMFTLRSRGGHGTRQVSKRTRTPFSMVIGLLGMLLCTMVSSTQAQMGGRMTSTELLKTLNPGQWVKLEGVIQRDSSILCKDVKVLTGDFGNDDWALAAVVKRVDKTAQQAYVSHLPIKFQKDTEFQSEGGTLKGFADLKPGMYIDLEGTYLKDGTFLVKEIEDESAKLKAEPELAHEIEAKGRVEQIDAVKRTITLMGFTCRLSERTRIQSTIR